MRIYKELLCWEFVNELCFLNCLTDIFILEIFQVVEGTLKVKKTSVC